MLIREIIAPAEQAQEAAYPALAAVQQQAKQLKVRKAQIKATKAQQALSKARSNA